LRSRTSIFGEGGHYWDIVRIDYKRMAALVSYFT
jgi:hypothetical protein